MTDAEPIVRFYPFRPVPLFFTSIFTPNVVLVPHFIIGYLFPNDGHSSPALALGAQTQCMVPTPTSPRPLSPIIGCQSDSYASTSLTAIVMLYT
jgi:hypothetical protein